MLKYVSLHENKQNSKPSTCLYLIALGRVMFSVWGSFFLIHYTCSLLWDVNSSFPHICQSFCSFCYMSVFVSCWINDWIVFVHTCGSQLNFIFQSGTTLIIHRQYLRYFRFSPREISLIHMTSSIFFILV